MSIFEYDKEKHMALIRSEGYEDGVAKGIAEGEDRLAALIQKLNDTDYQQEISHVLQDREYRQKLYQEFGI